MAVFILSYDLHNGRNYERLIGALKDLGSGGRGAVWSPLESVWFVAGPYSDQTLLQWAQGHIDNDDGLVVALMTQRPQALRAKKGTKEWLDKYFPG